MRTHDSEHERVSELRPKASRLEDPESAVAMRAALSGRLDVAGPAVQVLPTVRQALQAGRSTLASSRSTVRDETPELDAEVLLRHVLGVSRAGLYTNPGRSLAAGEARDYPLTWRPAPRGPGAATLDRLYSINWVDPPAAIAPGGPLHVGGLFTATDAAFAGPSDLGAVAEQATGVAVEGIATWVGDLAVWLLAWNSGRLRAEVAPGPQGSVLSMNLRYDGSLWGPVVEHLLADEIEQGRERLLALVSAPRR